MSILAKLEHAVCELQRQKDALIKTLEEACWKDDRKNNRIPAETDAFKIGELDWSSPELAPLPSGAHSKYQNWFSAVRVIISKNQPDRTHELDQLYEKIKEELRASHISKNGLLEVKDKINLQFDLLAAVPNHLYYSNPK